MARIAPSLFAFALLAGCAGGTAAPGDDATPTIVIAGIAEGFLYDGPVAINISIDVGSYSATLDGAAYKSGDTVRTPGAHVLLVTAHSSLQVVTRTVNFSVRAPDGGILIIRMLNLGPNEDGGGGDAIVITDSTSAGQVHALIDAGPAGANASDPGFVDRQLAALHIDTLSLMLLTHAHGDHYGGMPAVITGTKVKRFLYNGQVRNLASYNSVLSQATLYSDSVIVVNALRDYAFGYAATPTHIKFVPPLSTHLATTTDDGDDLNDGSVGARLDLGTFSMFFTGDGEAAANAHWMSSFASLVTNVTVLKVGHHGANNAIFDNGFSGTTTWLPLLAPHLSIISTNGLSHPRINAITRILAQPNNQTYCTSVHGMITIRVTRAGAYTVTVEKNALQSCVAGSEATT